MNRSWAGDKSPCAAPAPEHPPIWLTEEADEHDNGTWLPVSSGQGTAGPDDRSPASLIKLPATGSFDGRDHVLSAAALWLHLRAAAASVTGDHPGLVPGGYLRSLTGKDLYDPGDDPAALAAELCTEGLWEPAGGGYRILDGQAIEEFTGKVRELREKSTRAAEATATGMTRFGERIGRAAAASFRCAACGEMAAVVKVARAGTTVDMGPPLGRETYDRDALVVDYFFGTASRFADPATLDAVQEIVSSDTPDPVALRRIDWELAPFFCPNCGLNYCRADWDTFPVFDEGFYDCTIGICPGGHRHTVDD